MPKAETRTKPPGEDHGYNADEEKDLADDLGLPEEDLGMTPEEYAKIEAEQQEAHITPEELARERCISIEEAEQELIGLQVPEGAPEAARQEAADIDAQAKDASWAAKLGIDRYADAIKDSRAAEWGKEAWGALKATGTYAKQHPKEAGALIANVCYKTVTGATGTKFFGDVGLMFAKKGDLYNYIGQHAKKSEDRVRLAATFEKLSELYQQNVQEQEQTNEHRVESTPEELVERGREKQQAYLEQYGTAKERQTGFKRGRAGMSEMGQQMVAMKKAIDASENVSAEEKKDLKRQMGLIMAEHRHQSELSDEQRAQQAQDVLKTYLTGKIKGTAIAKDALNAALVGTGMLFGRGAVYAGMSGVERAQKAGTTYEKRRMMQEQEEKVLHDGTKSRRREKQRSAGELMEQMGGSKAKYILKDALLGAAKETANALMLRGADKTGEHRFRDFTQAVGTVTRGLGITGVTIHAFRDEDFGDIGKTVDEFLAAYSKGESEVGNARSAKYVAEIVGRHYKDNALRLWEMPQKALRKIESLVDDPKVPQSERKAVLGPKLARALPKGFGGPADEHEEAAPASEGAVEWKPPEQKLMDVNVSAFETLGQAQQYLETRYGITADKALNPAELHRVVLLVSRLGAGGKVELGSSLAAAFGEQAEAYVQKIQFFAAANEAVSVAAYLQEHFGVDPVNGLSPEEDAHIRMSLIELSAMGKRDLAEAVVDLYKLDAAAPEVSADAAGDVVTAAVDSVEIGPGGEILPAAPGEESGGSMLATETEGRAGGAGIVPEDGETAKPGASASGERIIEEPCAAVEGVSDESAAGTIPEVAAEEASLPAGEQMPYEKPHEIKKGGSIWATTRDIFKTNAKALGYPGEADDPEALERWARAQTGRAVLDLTRAQGGQLAEIVHAGDNVSVTVEDGRPILHFEAASGTAPESLPALEAEQVARVPEGMRLADRVSILEKAGTGGKGVLVDLPNGEKYQVFDWDADGRLDVILPSGKKVELSQDEFQSLMREKGMYATAEPMPLPEEHLSGPAGDDLKLHEDVKYPEIPAAPDLDTVGYVEKSGRGREVHFYLPSDGNEKLYQGQRVRIGFTCGEAVIHPMTGENLGSPELQLGEATVIKSDNGRFELKFDNDPLYHPAKGDVLHVQSAGKEVSHAMRADIAKNIEQNLGIGLLKKTRMERAELGLRELSLSYGMDDSGAEIFGRWLRGADNRIQRGDWEREGLVWDKHFSVSGFEARMREFAEQTQSHDLPTGSTPVARVGHYEGGHTGHVLVSASGSSENPAYTVTHTNGETETLDARETAKLLGWSEKELTDFDVEEAPEPITIDTGGDEALPESASKKTVDTEITAESAAPVSAEFEKKGIITIGGEKIRLANGEFLSMPTDGKNVVQQQFEDGKVGIQVGFDRVVVDPETHTARFIYAVDSKIIEGYKPGMDYIRSGDTEYRHVGNDGLRAIYEFNRIDESASPRTAGASYKQGGMADGWIELYPDGTTRHSGGYEAFDRQAEELRSVLDKKFQVPLEDRDYQYYKELEEAMGAVDRVKVLDGGDVEIVADGRRWRIDVPENYVLTDEADGRNGAYVRVEKISNPETGERTQIGSCQLKVRGGKLVLSTDWIGFVREYDDEVRADMKEFALEDITEPETPDPGELLKEKYCYETSTDADGDYVLRLNNMEVRFPEDGRALVFDGRDGIPAIEDLENGNIKIISGNDWVEVNPISAEVVNHNLSEIAGEIGLNEMRERYRYDTRPSEKGSIVIRMNNMDVRFPEDNTLLTFEEGTPPSFEAVAGGKVKILSEEGWVVVDPIKAEVTESESIEMADDASSVGHTEYSEAAREGGDEHLVNANEDTRNIVSGDVMKEGGGQKLLDDFMEKKIKNDKQFLARIQEIKGSALTKLEERSWRSVYGSMNEQRGNPRYVKEVMKMQLLALRATKRSS